MQSSKIPCPEKYQVRPVAGVFIQIFMIMSNTNIYGNVNKGFIFYNQKKISISKDRKENGCITSPTVF